MTDATDRERIDRVVASFFAAFDNRDDRIPSFEALARLFAPGAIVVRDSGAQCESYDVRAFIEPRLRLLTGGSLVDFREWETQSATEIVGPVAARRSRYAKLGLLDGKRYTGSGTKFFQLGRFADAWLICAVAWSDDP